ncbi:glutathione s-transferase [Paraphaeosphaeria minitans]|uniref:Glutathione s-transferase n=1 Tax=Paraphaeosphaeria minitans TaxID=565426 RepID=A0A9P6KPW7_9PLEO|nr:glutathione s-transferase [Paraphaeosphaeria minitans]
MRISIGLLTYRANVRKLGVSGLLEESRRAEPRDAYFWVLEGKEPMGADATLCGFVVSNLVCDAAPETWRLVKGEFPMAVDSPRPLRGHRRDPLNLYVPNPSTSPTRSTPHDLSRSLRSRLSAMMHFLATLLALFATASAVASNAPVDGAPNSNLTVSVDSALASNPTATSSVSTDTGSTEGLADDIAPVMADPVDCNWPSPRDQYCSMASLFPRSPLHHSQLTLGEVY